MVFASLKIATDVSEAGAAAFVARLQHYFSNSYTLEVTRVPRSTILNIESDDETTVDKDGSYALRVELDLDHLWNGAECFSALLLS